MADTAKQQVGKLGEEVAANFLLQQGYQIVDRNYWQKWGEIDIVAKKGAELRFVEVKTVTRGTLLVGDTYEPEDNLHPWKLRRLARVIETYLAAKKIPDEVDWQVDAISVYLDHNGQELKIEWLKDILL
jgi:putative endonuclease